MSRRPHLLELFSGSGNLSGVARRLGFRTTTLDWEESCGADVCVDIRKWRYLPREMGVVDWVHASIPCTEYSIMKTRSERDIAGANEIAECARATIDAVRRGNPRSVFTVENPGGGLLREQPAVQGLPMSLVDYCAYGMPYRKVTAIWHNLQCFLPKRCQQACCYAGKHLLQVPDAPVRVRSQIPLSLCVDLVLAAAASLGAPLDVRLRLSGGAPPGDGDPGGTASKEESGAARKDDARVVRPETEKLCAFCAAETSVRWYGRTPEARRCQRCYRNHRKASSRLAREGVSAAPS